MEKIKDYFKRYPQSDEVHENGGLLFHTKGGADSYGKGKTKSYTRKEVMSSESKKSDEDKKKAQELAEKEANEQTKTSAIETLTKAEDISALDYNLMKKLVKDLELSTGDVKKETLIAALTEYKATLKSE